MSAYEAEPRRGRAAIAILLAVALLAVVGAVGGYLLGVRHNEQQKAAGGGGSAPSGDAGRPCPDWIVRDAQRNGAVPPMVELLYVITVSQGTRTTDPNYRNASEVWICQDATPSSWYQGHRIKTARLDGRPLTIDPNTDGTGILLRGVNGIDNGKFKVTNTAVKPNTTYTVGPTELDVQTGNQVTVEPVVEHRP